MGKAERQVYIPSLRLAHHPDSIRDPRPDRKLLLPRC